MNLYNPVRYIKEELLEELLKDKDFKSCLSDFLMSYSFIDSQDPKAGENFIKQLKIIVDSFTTEKLLEADDFLPFNKYIGI